MEPERLKLVTCQINIAMKSLSALLDHIEMKEYREAKKQAKMIGVQLQSIREKINGEND